MSPRVKCLALLALLVVSSVAVRSAARPDLASRAAASTAQVGEDCAGLGEEECLMRRTLNSHIDYIYSDPPQP